ncbi:MAG TPA: sigma-70 family RNA polymerase sigma factor [Chloroflexota bacterium]|nr:sigma-70 family RNA polymerase sigma factor [Chloroflexota bacterium]
MSRPDPESNGALPNEPSNLPLNSVADLLEDYHRSPRPDIRERLIVLHLDLVSRLARQLAGRGPVLDDLIQVGYIGLMKAIDRFDPARGVAFSAFAIPTIAGEMKRYLRDKEPIIHIPRQVQERRRELERAIDALTQRHHRRPTAAELATELGWTIQQVEGTLASALANPISLDQPVPTGEESDGSLREVSPHADDDLQRSEDRVMLERLWACLTPRQQLILSLLFYEDLSQATIGERLSMSQMQVSRLSRAAIERLRQGLDSSDDQRSPGNPAG